MILVFSCTSWKIPVCKQQAGPHRSIWAKSWLCTIYFGGRAVTQTRDLHPGGPGQDTLPIDYFQSFWCMCELLHPYIVNTNVVGYNAWFLGTPVRSLVIGCTPQRRCGPKGGAHLLNSQNIGKPVIRHDFHSSFLSIFEPTSLTFLITPPLSPYVYLSDASFFYALSCSWTDNKNTIQLI